MSSEKEDFKKQLESIKDHIEKKLSSQEKIESKKVSKKEKTSNSGILKAEKPKKKPIPISVNYEVVSKIKKEDNSPKSKENNKQTKKEEIKARAVKPKTVKPSNKKKKSPLIPIILMVILLGTLFYIYSLKKGLEEDKTNFEKDKEEAIDYSNDVYFKEVDDEPDDEEMQDFAIYKDVPEVVASTNSKSETLSASDTKNIDKQIKQNNFNNNNSNVSKATNSNDTGTLVFEEDKNSNTTTLNTTTKESAEKPKGKKEVVNSDLIKIIGLQHKDGQFSLPKKAKKTNAFKIRIRLKKNQISKTEDDVNIMLVIKDQTGNTIKIDSKKVNFGKQNSKVLYLEFYEIFPERLKTDVNYSFSIFANKKLIKTGTKRI